MEIERKHSSGVAKGGLTTGIIGTSLGTLALLGTGGNLLGSLLGNNTGSGLGTGQALLDGMLINAMSGSFSGACGCRGNACGPCESDHFITRYDAEKDAKIAKLETDVALRDANTYSDQKALQLYQYIDGRLRSIESQIGQQAVVNESIAGQIKLAKSEADCCCQSLRQAIDAEASARCCGDNSIVNYANATFYPQMISDLTIGTTAKPQATWNPISNCGCPGGNP